MHKRSSADELSHLRWIWRFPLQTLFQNLGRKASRPCIGLAVQF